MKKKNYYTVSLFLSFLLICPIFYAAEPSAAQKKLLEDLPPDQRDKIFEKMEEAEDLNSELEEKFENPETLVERREETEEVDPMEPRCEECIYGYSFFKYAPSTFAPTDSISIPSDYVLGPGDKLEIRLYGDTNDKISSYVSREGKLIIPLLGPINVLGLTFTEASNLLKSRVSSELIGTEAFLSIKELRSISVFVLGEAYTPGRFTMSGLSSISNALFVAGGTNKQGSLRNIEIRRNSKIITIFDFYDFLLRGSLETDIRLLDGDVIFIPFIENTVRLGGTFKRPYLYEFKEGETIEDAINLAGGFKPNVLASSRIEISSIEGNERNLKYFNVGDNLDIKLTKGDSINISGVSGLVAKTIKIYGEVVNEGEYSIQKGDTILDILNRAGGYTEVGYPEGAVFLRESTAIQQKEGFTRSADELEKTLVNIISGGNFTALSDYSLVPMTSLITRLRDIEPLGRMVVNVDLLELKLDPYANFRVEDGDELYIPARPNTVSIFGEVLNSSSQRYVPGLSPNDYLSLAGGLSDQADKDKIFVIFPNGQAKIFKQTVFSKNSNNILPGSTIVVARDSKPWDAIKLTEVITPILANLATSAASLSVLSDRN